MATLYAPTLVIVLAVVEVLVLAMLVARGRGKYGVPAPAMTGHPRWERLCRVHQNSIEQLVMFIPLFFAYVLNVGVYSGLILGVVYLIARIVYAVGYVRDPGSRAVGAFLTLGVQAWLAVGALIGLAAKVARS
jgi:uncharacterized membrane protein YecN with MAPEG domain